MSIAVKERSVSADQKNRFWNARRHLDFTIDQDWICYSAAEHDRQDRLFKRSQKTLRDQVTSAISRIDRYNQNLSASFATPSQAVESRRLGSSATLHQRLRALTR